MQLKVLSSTPDFFFFFFFGESAGKLSLFWGTAFVLVGDHMTVSHESTMTMSRAMQGTEVLWGQPTGLWMCSDILTAHLPLWERGKPDRASPWPA